MTKTNYLKLFVFTLILSFSFKGFSQLSKKHFIPPLTSASFGNANPEDQHIYLSTPNNGNIPYTIIPVGEPVANYITGTVSNMTPQQIAIGTGNGQLFIPSTQTSAVINNRGYIIEAEAPIYVSVRMNAGGGAQAGALVSKGLSALGTTFRIGTFTNGSPSDNYLNFLSVMATEDNTQVNFSNLPAGLIIKNYTGATPINATLNEGESYTIAINSDDTVVNQDGLIGCLVNSDKPIVVNCGSTNGSFGTGGGRDYGIDQIVDVTKIGTEYIFVRGDGNDSWENALLVAHTDNTSISINGNAPITTINAGEYYVIEGNAYSTNGNLYVETSQPVFAYQGVGGLGNNGSPSEANQGLFFVPPLSCETRGNLNNIANINNIGSTNYDGGISIVTKVGATVTINNNPITVAASPVVGKPDYITYKVKGLNGNISVQSDDELYCAYFNYNGAATSGSFYSGFPSNPEINFDAQFATLGNCIPNITLQAANTQSFDSFKWLFDDGSGGGFSDLMITNSEITPTLPGKYKLIGIISCTGEELESIEIPISFCPDDRDNDGIIDNIDIDNDNDGILNCTESKGDVVMDLSDTRPPRLRFQNGTVNTSIASNNISNSGTNSVRLTGTGNIISTIPATNNSNNTYTLSFTELVNVKFTEDTSYMHSVIDDESFTVSILPNNKNITLVDPDNRLLVDSNFDGIFETGVTQISNSEIRFRVNPSPSGNTPYEFLSSQVDSFTFIHINNNILQPSTFQGQVSLTCFTNDNDLDGIPDAFDLDSDNDGIPDGIENQGALVTLSGIDADSNGLDDVFNSSDLPIDTDNDTVLDFYDLDSDNDGIYDLIETGQLGTLSDTDLNGIVDGPNFGINGWADAAETTPDSNEIGYVLNDLDNDTVFSYIDSDSDGDTCSDVIEAGFQDGNTDTFLGNISPTVNDSGLVNNATDGYILPDANYLDFAPLNITTQPENTETCEVSNTTISVVSAEAESYQWEVSTDGVTWNTIVHDAIYSNSQTANLNITNTPLTFNTYKYRVKINRNGNSCGLYSDAIELTIIPMPTINSPVVLIQCDDDDLATLGFSPFNLTEANNEISINASNETFSYYLTQAAAILGDITSPDYINNPTTFENRTISTDVIWARIESSLGCVSTSQIQLNVSTTAVPPTFVATFNQCDDFLDSDGNDNTNNDDRDGIATFDFSSVTATVLSFIPPGQNVLPPRYYRNEADALAEINEIINVSNYRNIGFPNSQFIYVRVDSAITNDCLGLGAYVQLNVEPLPLANPVSIDRQCNDDAIDNQFPFNTSQIESDVLGSQNPADFTFSYVDELGNTLPSPLPNPFLTASQTITIRITNSATTAPDGPCYDETTLEFIVDEQPVIANTITILPVCDDGLDGTDKNDGFHSFDTSTFESTIRGSQSNMNIFFNYIDENGATITNATTLPNPLISGNQTISVDLVNPMNTICSASTTIDLIVNMVPEFSLEEEITVCGSPFTPFDLEPIQTNPSENFTYEWTFQDGRPLGNTLILPSIPQPGMYTLKLTNPSTLCSNSLTVDVKSADPPNISINNVDIKDLRDNNSVTVLNPSSLGNSSYVFSLVSEDGTFFFPYQDSPVFNNVSPGFYKLFVRDNEDLCDEVSIDISVIGHQKFFTPNDDGFNEFWQIQGLNTSQDNSVIQIYDRYGKFLKQLSPFEIGWDGTFNGALMPTGDYWFKLELQDKRTLMGHFTLKR